MNTDILNGLLEGLSPWMLLPVLAVLLLALLGPRRRRQTSRSRSMVDPRAQLEAVSRVAFERQPLLNRSESAVLATLEACIGKIPGYRVMAQTSLGELIRPSPSSGSKADRSDAFASINSKRLDFAVIDPTGHLAIAIEYQGRGHHSDTSVMRDAVKREALRRAGVEMMEIPAKWDADLLSKQVRYALIGETEKAEPAA
ncbi:MAG: DUF2726 domain-containing protein [Pseudomonadota bacterium]